MLSYLARRLLLGLFTLVLVTFVVYGLIRSIPGTPLTMAAENIDPSRRMSKVDQEMLVKAYGLDKNWFAGYWVWLRGVANFDLSNSIRERRAVTLVIWSRMGPTLLLSGASLLITYLLSVPLGLYSTVRSGKFDERTTSVFLYVLYSLPTYVAALQLLLIFYVRLRGTAFQMKPGMVSDNYSQMSVPEGIADIGWHLILPLICFTYGSLAYYSRFVKANMEEVIRQDYIRTARAKGVGPMRILIHHAFRNTLIPFVTLIGLTLPGLLSGAIILEQIFSWPGMGSLFFSSLLSRDYPVIMGLTLMFSILTLAGQLLADILYCFVDPRITYS
jgi:peptide/nickel transport system permease protein